MLSPVSPVASQLIKALIGEDVVRNPSDVSQFNLPANIIADMFNQMITASQTRNPVDPLLDLFSKYAPGGREIVNNFIRPGEADVRLAGRYLRQNPPEGIEARDIFAGGTPRANTLTPIMRRLVDAIARGDDDDIERYTQAAIDLMGESGIDRDEALRRIRASIGSRSPSGRSYKSRPTSAQLEESYSSLGARGGFVRELEERFDRYRQGHQSRRVTRGRVNRRRRGLSPLGPLSSKKRKRSALSLTV